MLRRMPNSVYLKVYQDHFLLGYPLAEVAEKLDAAWHLLDSIDSRAVHAWLDRWNAGDLNRIYAVLGNNPDYPFPDSETLTRLLREARQSSPAPYVQAVADTLPSLMDFTPVAGRIVKTKRLKGPGAEEWTLSNGAKVYYKHNDYESGAFNLLAGSPGGRSLLPAEDLPSADALNTLFLQYGLYKYPARLLNAIMRGHNIDINIDLGERSESISRSSTRDDADIASSFFP